MQAQVREQDTRRGDDEEEGEQEEGGRGLEYSLLIKQSNTLTIPIPITWSRLSHPVIYVRPKRDPKRPKRDLKETYLPGLV